MEQQPRRSGRENSATKRRRKHTPLNEYIDEFAEQFAAREISIDRNNVSYGSSQSQSQHVWLMIVDRLRKEVLNARDCHRADTLARSRLLTSASPPCSSSSNECSLCKKNKAMAITDCAQFLCWGCLCKWHRKGPSKKLCPCCLSMVSKCHIVLIDEKPDVDSNNNSNTNSTRMTMDRPAVTQPVWVDTISAAPVSVNLVNDFLPMAPGQPNSLTLLIPELESSSGQLFLDDVLPYIESQGELVGRSGVSCNTTNTNTNTEQLTGESLDSPELGLSDILFINSAAESSIETVEMRWNQGQELEQYSFNTVWEADSLNVRDLDSLLDDKICDWSLFEQLFPL